MRVLVCVSACVLVCWCGGCEWVCKWCLGLSGRGVFMSRVGIKIGDVPIA